MKKLLISILIVVLLLTSAVAIFAACDNRDYDHTIVFYSTQNDELQGLTAVAIARFEAKFPGWKVDHQQPGGYEQLRTKIVQDLSGKKQPDIAYCYADHVALYMQKKKVVDISTLINSDATVTGQTIEVQGDGKYAGTGETTYEVGFQDEMDNFVPAFLKEGYGKNFTGASDFGYSDESLLMLPFMKSTEAMFYNRTALEYIMNQLKTKGDSAKLALFSDDGGTTLKLPRTWDDMWAQAPVITEYFPKATLLGYDSEANWFITESERQGWGYTSTDANNHYLFDNARARAWLDYLYDFNEKGYITTQQIYGAYTSNLFKNGVGSNVDKGTGGGAIYCVGSTGGAKNQATNNFTWGVAQIPGSYVTDAQGNKTQEISDLCISQGPSLVMLKSDKAKNADEKAMMTFMFMKELFEADIQAELCILQGYTPALINVAEKYESFADYLKGNDITAQAINLANQLAAKDLFFSSPAFVGSSTARTQVGNALQDVLLGNSTGSKALSDAKKNCG